MCCGHPVRCVGRRRWGWYRLTIVGAGSLYPRSLLGSGPLTRGPVVHGGSGDSCTKEPGVFQCCTAPAIGQGSNALLKGYLFSTTLAGRIVFFFPLSVAHIKHSAMNSELTFYPRSLSVLSNFGNALHEELRTDSCGSRTCLRNVS